MKHLYPIITTANPRECRDFYQRVFGARLLFQQEWYVQLAIEHFEIGFLAPNPPVKLPVFSHASVARGLTLAVEVDDVRKLYAEVQRAGVPRLAELAEFPGGEWAFAVVDPAGVVLNIVERHAEGSSSVVEL